MFLVTMSVFCFALKKASILQFTDQLTVVYTSEIFFKANIAKQLINILLWRAHTCKYARSNNLFTKCRRPWPGKFVPV